MALLTLLRRDDAKMIKRSRGGVFVTVNKGTVVLGYEQARPVAVVADVDGHDHHVRVELVGHTR